MTSDSTPPSRSGADLRRTSIRRTLHALLALSMVLGSVATVPGVAGAAPGYLKDVDVAHVDGDLYMTAALSQDGSIQVQPMICQTDTFEETCNPRGWATVGRNATAVQITTLRYDTVLLVARLTNGQTWYRKGACDGVGCSWQSWNNLGGNVVSVSTGQDFGTPCADIAGLSPGHNVYTARVCGKAWDGYEHSPAHGWKSLGGKLTQVSVGNDYVVGVSANKSLWWYDPYVGDHGSWQTGGGQIRQAVAAPNQEFCGLASSNQMWCFEKEARRWYRVGGDWRKLDDDQPIGISRNWSFLEKGVKDDFADIGGTVNQVADDRYLQVGVSGSGRLWYRTSYCGYNVWYPG
ncbi:exported hypothetical protein [Candidatus Microthrix parvicella RN1]|jgi:hypothetical protein|uniref:Uncharacterized protein n=1 Tax=Candidatus Neomicrothrix parvicella RN1 TaxID=1229780 RepID=R4YVU4_9ACTN|nr:exported hypothetical protein [Candidatus Microthrix parvicella RN1]